MATDTDHIIDCMVRMKGDNQPFALATVVHSKDATAAKAGAKAILRADGSMEGWIGGGCALGAVRKAAAKALVDGKPRLIRIRPGPAGGEEAEIEEYKNSCASEGTLEVFVEPVLPRPSLVIVGASPVARALCDLAKRIGYAVTAAALPGDVDAMTGADRRIEGFDLSSDPRAGLSQVVVATQGKRDREALEGALAAGAPYVAFVGSRKKAAALKEALAENGADPARLAAIRSPAGLDIGAATPEEIALSVLAEMVQDRRAAAAAVATPTVTAAPTISAPGR